MSYRYLAIFVLSVIFCDRVNAQRVLDLSMESNTVFNEDTKIAGGLVLGLNATQVDGDFLNGYHKGGLNAGAIGMIRFGKKFYANLEILFAQKGSVSVRSKESSQYGLYFSKYRIKLNYAEVPVVINYKITDRYHFGVGASYNNLISSREDENDANGVYEFDPAVYSFNSSYFDFILNLNAVVYKGLVANLRYQYSITPIRAITKVREGYGFADQMNNQFAFRLLYFF